MQFQGMEAQHKQPCVVIWRNQVCDVECCCEKENLYKNCYSAFQAVGNSTNEHHNDATGHACAVGVHQWNEISEHKISGSKHIDGSRV